jgi:hypothetical protein
VSVRATRDGTAVSVGDHSHDFEDLTTPTTSGTASAPDGPPDDGTAPVTDPDAAEEVRP